MSIVQEFKEFATKGNAIDLAVALIVGAAFNKIVQSVVNDILMPPIGLMIGGVEFKELRVVLKEALTDPETAEVAIRYGAFVNTIVEFIIVAFTAFLVVKVANRLIRKREDPAA